MKVGLRKYAGMPDVVSLVQQVRIFNISPSKFVDFPGNSDDKMREMAQFPAGIEPRNHAGARNEVVSGTRTSNPSIQLLFVWQAFF